MNNNNSSKGEKSSDKKGRSTVKRLGLILGPVIFVIFMFAPVLEELPFEAKIVLAATFWMLAWWITEAIPIYVTALLPLALFPSFGVTDVGDTSVNYADRVVFLFLGGFILAKAVERSNLHKRFALNLVKAVGTNPKYIVAAFMVATGLLSGWMSNTATVMLMFPIAAAVIIQLDNKRDRERFGLCLMLGLAYSGSVGGMATLIGTPPNAILASLSGTLAETSVTFGEWLIIGLPISLISLVVIWFYLVNVGASIRGMGPIAKEKDLITKQLKRLGRITKDERTVIAVFAATATAWITRGLLWGDVLPLIDDTTIVLVAALSLFLIPSLSGKRRREMERDESGEREEGEEKGEVAEVAEEAEKAEGVEEEKNKDSGRSKADHRLMDWKTAVTIPWGILLLIGGGLALANAYAATGLDQWIAQRLGFLEGFSFLIVVFVMVAVAILISEIMTNTASAALLIPISASLAVSLNIDPILLMIPVTIATSYGFMMPVGTPPNAIVYASGYVTVPKMVRAGLPLDIIGIILVTGLTAVMVPLIWS